MMVIEPSYQEIKIPIRQNILLYGEGFSRFYVGCIEQVLTLSQYYSDTSLGVLKIIPSGSS